MINIDSILEYLKSDEDCKKYSILLASIMFIWSGIDKVLNFDKKIITLSEKINFNTNICTIAMVLVILLEIIGFLLLVEYFFNNNLFYNLLNKINIFIKLNQEQAIQIILLLVLLFIFVVTIIYHPPWGKPIPFLSNLTIFSFFLYIYSDLFRNKKNKL